MNNIRLPFPFLLTLLVVLFQPAFAVTPSPPDWRDLMIYQVITDRIWDGDPANNNLEGSFEPATGNKTHGGDFAGLERKLDYMKGLGVGAIWISPVVLNAHGEYHGYAARDFYSISSQMGGLADLQSFINEAHSRGIYVVVDVVLNHTGDMIGSFTPGYPCHQPDPSPYVLQFWNASPRQAVPFNNLAWYHNNGEIQNFNDPEQILGELAGLDDLKTELPAVRDALVDATKWLIDVTDCDGFRIDTVKHTELGFWQDWTPRVKAHTDSIGKTDFLMFGEVFDGSDFKNGIYTGTQAGGAYALNSVLYYPMHFTTNDVFVYDQPTSRLTDRYNQLGNYDPTVRERLVKFLDNHDLARFLAFQKANQDTTKLRVALDWILASSQIPCLYYGTEQSFDGGGDPWSREDLWDGQWDFGPSEGDHFNMTQPLYLRTARLNDLRRLYPALTRGTQFMLQHDAGGPGLYVYSRQYAGDEVIVAHNTSATSETTTSLNTTWGPNVPLIDLADTSLVVSTNVAGTVVFTVPARDSRIITVRNGPVRLNPHVLAQSPAHDSRSVPALSPIVLTFNEPMDTLSVLSRFDMVPPVTGSFSWSANRRTMMFTPLSPLISGQFYDVTIERDAVDATGRPLRAAFETRFQAAASASGITVPAGYDAEILAENGLSVPEGLEFGPGSGGWNTDLFVGDEALQKVLRVTSAGLVTTFAASATLCQKPEGLIIDATGQYGGDMVTADDEQYPKASPGGAFSPFGTSLPPSRTGTITQAPVGAFGGLAYTSSVDDDTIYRLEPGGTLTLFASGLGGVEGLAFGPGGAWGTDLYAMNADLTGLASTIDGDAALYRVNSSGTASLFVQDVSQLSAGSALVFDTIGGFDGDLFVANVVNETILRVTPSGQVSVFASGFGNLFGSDCLAFGPDGSLYVADTGGGQPFTDSSGGTAVGRVIRIVRLDTTSVPEPGPGGFRMASTPNPFRSSTRLQFNLPRASNVTIGIFDIRGREVIRLVDGPLEARVHSIEWSGRDAAGRRVPSGLYLAHLEAGDFRWTVKLTVGR